MLNGLISLPWWGYLLVALTFTHLTIVSVTIYLHRHQAHRALGRFQRLRTVYTMKQKLRAIWQRSAATHEHLLHALQEWCHDAEATGIQALREFARKLRSYSLAQPTP